MTYRLLPGTEERLLAHRRITESGCWEWTSTSRGGYGRIWIQDRHHTVHRVAADLWIDGFDYDSPLFVCHHCDNPPCFRPDHLFIGSHAENMADASRKGRMWSKRGPRKTIYPRVKPCAICGREYAPDEDHRGRSQVCSAECLGVLRSRFKSGQGHKLTAESVARIRARLADGATGVAVAREFGVSTGLVSTIRNRKVWVTVP